jgi:long-chain fatty acid transport protein
MSRLIIVVALGVVFLAGFAGEAFAGGVSFTEHGAAATGKANAFAGEANDPSAIFYNPAGITQLPGTQIMFGTSVIYLDSTFRSSTTNESTELQDQFPLVPHFYITHRFKAWDERLSLGLGVYTPFGLVVDWPDNWQGRFDSTNVKLRVTLINPIIAFRATKDLSLAAGIRITNAAAEFERKFAVPAFGIGESKLRVHDLTAHPIGWNVGLLYHIHETTSVGVQFKSEIQAKFNGDADFTGPAAAFFSNTRFHTSLKMPPQLVLGISTRIIPRWTINADVEWEGWRTVGAIPLHFETTSGSTADQILLDSPGPRLWHNSYIYRLGAEFKATDRLALRLGYFYDQSPIPDNTFDSNIPTSNLHAITGGFGYKWDTTTLDIAYLIGFYEKRAADNSSIDPFMTGGTGGPPVFGSFSTTAHVLTVSLTKKF